MSIFLVSALSALGFGAMLTATMVISLDGWATGNWVHIAMGPALHLATALSVSRRAAGAAVVLLPAHELQGSWHAVCCACRACCLLLKVHMPLVLHSRSKGVGRGQPAVPCLGGAARPCSTTASCCCKRLPAAAPCRRFQA